MELVYEHAHCADLWTALGVEWLDTNGRGGYASTTIADCHTRKYHGLLVVPIAQFDGKFVLLSKVEAALEVGGQWHELGCNRYPGVYHPQGHTLIAAFRCRLHPVTVWQVGEHRLRREVLLVQDRDTVLLRYCLEGPTPARLRLNPLLAYRNMHALTRANSMLRGQVDQAPGAWSMLPYPDMPRLHFQASLPLDFHPGGYWHYRIEYALEQARGFDFEEDLYCPGRFETVLEPDGELYFHAGTTAAEAPLAALWRGELDRRADWEPDSDHERPMLRLVKTHARRFLITNPRGRRSVVAGYPWFGEWGRDAMIALPGLTVYAGNPDPAADILLTWAGLCRRGLIPNYLGFDERGDAYNSVDASLWFFWAAQECLPRLPHGDHLARQLLPTMREILGAFAGGKAPHVRCRDDGLLYVGTPRTQLTWMDAQVHGQPVTPRHGLAVEINALWYNALCAYAEWRTRLGEPADPQVADLRERCRAAFAANFWMPDAGYLADVISDHGVDRSLRPNQVFAVSLPHSALSTAQMAGVVAAVRRELTTPFGLRTLAPSHPGYRSHYGGSPEERDGAYHQGTVWPWLTGAYVAASLRVANDKGAEAEHLYARFRPLFEDHPRHNGLGSISEIMSAEPPHYPDGCIAQAWSVAEVIRAQELLRPHLGG